MSNSKPIPSPGSLSRPSRAQALLRNHYLFAACLAVLTTVIFWNFLFSDMMLSSSDQITGIDTRVVLKESLLKYGQFPEWLPSRLSGMPSVDAMFGDAMYPPSLLLYTVMPMHKALGFIMVLHVFLAGIFFYVMMLRGFGAPPVASFVSAAFYMLNPEFVSHVYPGHSGKMMVIAWLPFVVWRLKTLLGAPCLRNATLFSLGIIACLFTSHTQMTYFMCWGLFFYLATAMVLDWRAKRGAKRIAVSTAWFWGAVVFGVAASSLQFLPSFLFIRDAFSVRGADRGFEYAASWSLHWPEFFSMWVPEFGNWLDYYWGANPFKLNTEYAGAMAGLFAVLAVVYKPTAWRVLWASIAAFALLYSMGAHTPVFHIAYYIIPGVRKFRAASMIMFWFSFAVALLAGLFFKDILKDGPPAFDERHRKRWQKGLAITLGAFTLLALLFSAKGFVSSLIQGSLDDERKSRIFDLNFSAKFVPALWMWWVMAGVAVGGLWAVMSGKLKPLTFLAIVLVLGLFDTMRIDRNFIEVVSPAAYFSTDPQLTRLADRMPSAPFRCFFLPGAFTENAAGIYGLEGIGGFHDNELQWYRDFRGDQQDQNFYEGILGRDEQGQPYLDVAALKHGNNFLNLANMCEYVSRQGSRVLTLENEDALGRISFVTNYVVMQRDEIAGALKANRYDIRTTTALLQEPAQKPAPLPPSGDSTRVPAPKFSVTWEKYTTNDRAARVSCDRDGFLRISEVYYPGWKVRIDGVPAKIYQADLAWMAVAVRAGEHKVEMEPHSLYLAKAAAISYPLLSILALYWIVLGVMRLRRRSVRVAGR